jgi:heme-degrading monooxygenase HmoA
VILCQFIFQPGEYDEDFHRLDDQIDAFARALPGFRGTRTWRSTDGTIINASYYFDSMDAVKELSRLPEHLEAKGQYQRWYDSYEIVVSEISATYGDDRLDLGVATPRP